MFRRYSRKLYPGVFLTKISTMHSHFIVFIAQIYYIKIIYVYTDIWETFPCAGIRIFTGRSYIISFSLIVMCDISAHTNFRWKIQWWFRQYPIPNYYFYRIRSGELPDLTNFQCIYRPICVIYKIILIYLFKYNSA